MQKKAEGLTEHLKIKHKKYTLKFKKEVVTFAKQNSVNGASTLQGIEKIIPPLQYTRLSNNPNFFC